MKKFLGVNLKFTTTLLIITFLFSSCNDDFNQEINLENTESSALKSNDLGLKEENGAQSSNIYHDGSGQVEIKIISQDFGPLQHNQDITLKIGEEYVVIGGGAWAQYTHGIDYGALLTESIPDEELEAWIVGSKDHHEVDYHTLTAYVIGLKLTGLTREQLFNNMELFSHESPTMNHPSTFMDVNEDFKLIGGGAKANWNGFGSLLVHSYPAGNTWYVKSKDHHIADATTITSYAIGIKNTIPGFGALDIAINSSPSSTSSDQDNATVILPSGGWVLACPGAKATFNGFGRMLTKIRPVNGLEVDVQSKDHRIADGGSLRAYAVRIRKSTSTGTGGTGGRLIGGGDGTMQ